MAIVKSTAVRSTAVSDELAALRALVEEQRQRLEALETAPAALRPVDRTPRSRRDLLKLAGAAVVGAAGTAALRTIPVAAADGDSLILGNVAPSVNKANASTFPTYYAGPSGAFQGFNLLNVDIHQATSNQNGQPFVSAVWGHGPSGGTGINGVVEGVGNGVFGQVNSPSTNKFGITGVTGMVNNPNPGPPAPPTYGTGVFGFVQGDTANSIGVAGSTQNTGHTGAGCGVNGQSDTGCGVFAGCLTGAGLFAQSNSGPGGVFMSATGMDVYANGSGRIAQFPQVILAPGTPSVAPGYMPGHNAIELVRSDDGSIWASRALNGAPLGFGQGAWRRMNSVRVDSAAGDGTFFKPVRIVETRASKGVRGGITGPLQPNQTYTWPASGSFLGMNGIPSDAVGIVGNLTVVTQGGSSFGGGGYVAIFPAGVVYTPGTDPSTVNFGDPLFAVPNGFTIGFGIGANAGKFSMYIYGSVPVYVLVDVTAVLQ
jgi:hypothetical protein